MFTQPLPENVAPRLLAEENVVLEGAIPLSRFLRLADYLCDGRGDVRVKLQFHQGKHGVLVIVGHMRADVAMQCQYCLDPVEVAVSAGLDLVLVDSARSGTAGELPDAIVLEEDNIGLVALVEDDLILSLPMVAKHGSGDCIGKLEYNQDEGPTDSPFAVLERLKQK
jgi:uncharacterized protein